MTLVFARSPWLPSPEHVIEVPVRCLISTKFRPIKVDLVTPLCPLPEELLKPHSSTEGERQRRAFRVALRSAVENHLGVRVSDVENDRIEWEIGDGMQ